MEDYQQRVVDEKNMLDRKIEKLVDFTHSEVHGNLECVHQSLLMVQLVHMESYSSVLGRRIEMFKV